jgi:hypothetical protein
LQQALRSSPRRWPRAQKLDRKPVKKGSLPPWTTLALPLAISIAPWTCVAATFLVARDNQPLGNYFLTALVGALSFVLTGPAIGIILGNVRRAKVSSFWSFAVIFFVLSLPVLAFQILVYSCSILSLFFDRSVSTSQDMARFYAYATIIAVGFYAVNSMILFTLARRGRYSLIFGATVLCCAPVALIVARIR